MTVSVFSNHRVYVFITEKSFTNLVNIQSIQQTNTLIK